MIKPNRIIQINNIPGTVIPIKLIIVIRKNLKSSAINSNFLLMIYILLIIIWLGHNDCDKPHKGNGALNIKF